MLDKLFWNTDNDIAYDCALDKDVFMCEVFLMSLAVRSEVGVEDVSLASTRLADCVRMCEKKDKRPAQCTSWLSLDKSQRQALRFTA